MNKNFETCSADEELLKDWTIRSIDNGAIQATGIIAHNEQEAVDEFYNFKGWDPNFEVYASEAQWND